MSQRKNPSVGASSVTDFVLRTPRGLPAKEAKEFAVREVFLAVTPLPASAATLPGLSDLAEFSTELSRQERLVAAAEPPSEWVRGGGEDESDSDDGHDMGDFESDSDDGEEDSSDDAGAGDDSDEDSDEGGAPPSAGTTLFSGATPGWGAQVSYSSCPRWSPLYSPSQLPAHSAPATVPVMTARKGALALLEAVARAYTANVINPPRAAFVAAPAGSKPAQQQQEPADDNADEGRRRRSPRTLPQTPVAEAEAVRAALDAHCAALEAGAAESGLNARRFITVPASSAPATPTVAAVAPVRRRALWGALHHVCKALEALGGAPVAQVTVGMHVLDDADADEDEDGDEDEDEKPKSKSKSKAPVPAAPAPTHDSPRTLDGLGLAAFPDGGALAALWSEGCPRGDCEELVWVAGAEGAAPRWTLLAPLPPAPAPRPVLPGPKPKDDEEGCVTESGETEDVPDDVDVEGDAPRDVGQCVRAAVSVAAHAAQFGDCGQANEGDCGQQLVDLFKEATAGVDADADADGDNNGDEDEDEDEDNEMGWKLGVEFITTPPPSLLTAQYPSPAAAAAAAATTSSSARDDGVRASFSGLVQHHARHGPGAAVLGDGALLTGTWIKGKFSGIDNAWHYTARAPSEGSLRGIWRDGKAVHTRFVATAASAAAVSAGAEEEEKASPVAPRTGTPDAVSGGPVPAGPAAHVDAFGLAMARSLTAHRTHKSLLPDGSSVAEGDATADDHQDTESMAGPPFSAPRFAAAALALQQRALFAYDPSTASRISRRPLQPEPWERVRVRAAQSRIPDSGEGLFAVRALPAGELVAFYNGTRPLSSSVDARAWSLNGNAITVVDDEKTCIDVPAPYDAVSSYSGSLAHKANHVFDPAQVNAAFELYWHPRFGKLKAVRLTRPVPAGAEINVDYGYARGGRGGPQWFKDGVKARHAAVKAQGGSIAEDNKIAAAAANGEGEGLGHGDKGDPWEIDVREVQKDVLPEAAVAALAAIEP